MFLGIKMTPAAALTLKVHGLPQERAVCVPTDLWDEYVLGETPVERSCYVMQLLADLRDYVSEGTGEWAFPEITEVVMKWGLVESLRSYGRNAQDADSILAWLNMRIREQQPPQVAVSTDGSRMRILLGDASMPAQRFPHHQATGQKFNNRYQAEQQYAREHDVPADTPLWDTHAYYKNRWEWDNGRKLEWQQ
ncbi:hypothetical protein [Rhizobium ruizarguesonis]|uniref:hypothetical protein n=1 Tax=Rhizobium ruizarguesonis TaxID=2081791 RepID=UPI0010323CCB|nr:hypothetical protein [Rhizobium ruizarguesonis]TBF08915.1 hypothetical protein ELG96_09515 [Rhizobium ruizarguesonis]